MIQFGAGRLLVNPVGGNLANNPTPQAPAILQDVSLDVSVDLKELRGQNQFPEDIAPGDMKVSGKFSFGRLRYDLLNQIMFGSTKVAGGTAVTPPPGESGSVPGTPYQLTVTHASGFLVDLGVVFSGTGQPLERTSAPTPTTGQYNVSAGVYTFSAADQGAGVLINYTYTNATVGYTVQLTNHLMGWGAVFELYLAQSYQSGVGIPSCVHLFQCRAGKISTGTKRADYQMIDVDYSAFANAAGQVAELIDTGS